MNRRDRKEQKRLAILHAATEVFVESDFHHVLMDEVAARAKVGKGTLYRYFPTKNELYLEAIFAGWERLHEELRRTVSDEDTMDSTLRKIAEKILGYFWERRDFVTLVYRLEGKRGGKEWAVWQSRRKGTVAMIEAVLQRGLSRPRLARTDARLLTEIFLGMLRAAILHRGQRDRPKGLARIVVQVFLAGVTQATSTESGSEGD